MKRWDALLVCMGNWSGGIGWYDVTSIERKIALRPQDKALNMRLSFHKRPDNDDIADWIVYHARSRGSKDHVVLEKNGGPSELQAFYCFDGGIIGRTGRNILEFPVVEHGFWADGMRRTVVLVFGKSNSSSDNDAQYLERICFLQQAKQPTTGEEQEFDVTATNLADVSILPKGPSNPRPLNVQEKRQLVEEWSSTGTTTFRAEELDGCGSDGQISSSSVESSSAADALAYLFSEDDDDVLCIELPNGVFVACPWSLSKAKTSSRPFKISLGYSRACGQLSILETEFDKTGALQTVRANWYEKKEKY